MAEAEAVAAVAAEAAGKSVASAAFEGLRGAFGPAGAAAAVAMQAISAAVSIPKQEIQAEDTANAICKQITAVNGKIQAMQALRDAIGKDTVLNSETSAMINELNTELVNDINSIKTQKKASNTRLMVTIILNIFLLALVAIQLFS
jgi:hypothetical protein